MVKLKLWEATVRADVTLLGRSVPGAVKVSVLADTFERAATLSLDAALAELTELEKPPTKLELMGLEAKGPVWTTEIDMLPTKGMPA